jgi:Mrp family chromosome partitioning ATPase
MTSAADAEAAQDPQAQRIAQQLSRIRHTLLVMSGKGGVGKSSVAAQVSLALANKGFRVGLMDVDLHGPSIATIFGLEGLLDVDPSGRVSPKTVAEGLQVVSMQSLLTQRDQAVIWRGPVKTGVIRQFIGDIQWGDLDFLVIDAPPGTGDEPLSIAQMIPAARAVIVTTPQEVALADVRKSIHFCRLVGLAILGLVENMGPFPCPCCGRSIALFKSGGGEATSAQAGIPLLGTLPFDTEVRHACDAGRLGQRLHGSAAYLEALQALILQIVERL